MGLMTSSTSKAQRVNLSDLASLELPANAQKVAPENINALAKSKNINVQKSPETDHKTVYIYQDVVVTFRISKSKEKVDLVDLKKKLVALADGPSGMRFRSYAFNGNSFLVMENAHSGKLTVFGTNSKLDISIRVLLEFNEKNLTVAYTVLDKVLNGISFKR